MSATLRYDIGLAAGDVLNAIDGGKLKDNPGNTEASRLDATYEDGDFRPSLLKAVGAKRTSRWGGVHVGYAPCVTLSVKLPSQVEMGYRLLYRAFWMVRDSREVMKQLSGRTAVMPYVVTTLARKSLGTLARKLALSMGLEDYDLHGGIPDIFAAEGEDPQMFTKAIAENPGDVATWMAFADWLSERSDAGLVLRGKIIRGWLDKKPLKMKYGIPIIATPSKWSWLQDKE